MPESNHLPDPVARHKNALQKRKEWLITMNSLLLASIFFTGVLAFDLFPLVCCSIAFLALNTSAIISSRRQEPMQTMSLRTKSVVVNVAMLLGLLVSLHRYPLFAVALTGVILFPFINLLLFLQAKKAKDAVKQG